MTTFVYKERRRCHRPAHTCLECHRRKIKCSRTKPCTNCASSQQECVYSTTSRTTTLKKPDQYRLPQTGTVPARYPSMPGMFVGKIQPERNFQGTAIFSNSAQGEVDVCGSGGPGTLQRTVSDPNPNPKVAGLSDRIEDLERVFTTRALDHAGRREIYSAQPMLQDGRAALNKTRIFGSSHWLNIAYQV